MGSHPPLQFTTRLLGVQQNVGDSEGSALLGTNLASQTPAWQSDNPWIRIPARIPRWIRLTMTTHPLATLLVLGFVAISMGLGYYTWVQIKQNRVPLLLLPVFAFAMIFWSIHLKSRGRGEFIRNGEDRQCLTA